MKILLRTFGIAAGFASLAVAATGCEDNPDQFYKQAPTGAGHLWNDGKTAPQSDSARNSFNDNFNSSTADSLCAGPVKHKVWSDMVNAPIIPPRKMAQLDLAGSDAWTGLKFTDAQKINCQANPLGSDGSTFTAAWGDAREVQVQYLVNNNTIHEVILNQGYRGNLDFKSRPTSLDDPSKPNPFGQHTYRIAVGMPVLRDGQQWPLNWSSFDKQATEMFDALMYTFAPELGGDQNNCNASQKCLARPTGGGTAVFGARPLGIYMHIPSIYNPPPAPSTPDYLYAFYVKLMPFSSSSMFLKLDEEGPIAKALGLGDRKVDCVQHLGMRYDDFLDHCVNVLNDPAQNAITLGKFLGGMKHDKESYDLTIQGVDMDFTSSEIGDDKIVGDDWKPQDADVSYHMNMDVRATGTLLNEYAADGKTYTMGGTGAIYREYARTVLEAIHTEQKKFDPTYTGFDFAAKECTIQPGQDAKTWRPAKGCSGFEQFITPAEHITPTVSAGVRALSIGTKVSAFGFNSALKPGDPIAMFCADPSPNPDGKDTGAACQDDSECWSLSCDPDAHTCHDVRSTFFQHCGKDDLIGMKGSVLDTSFNRVIDYLGAGNPLNVAPALRDRKFYFTHLGHAIAKYLITAATYPVDLNDPKYDGKTGTACTPAGDPIFRSCEPDPDHLQFDQMGSSGDRNKFEYIDRRWGDKGLEPMSFEYETLVLSSNQQNSTFQRKLDRDEKAVFWTMAPDKTKPIGDEANNLRISNLIGSPIISGWQDTKVAGKDAFYCASTLVNGKPDSDCSAVDPKNVPPKNSMTGQFELDDMGRPLLAMYKGVFTGTPFSLGTSYMKFVEGRPLNKGAKVNIPFFADPYNPAGVAPAATNPGKFILPDWRPKAPGSGFEIPINAQLDRFVPAEAVDLSGQNLSMKVDYRLLDDSSMKILAVESETYEGEVFICKDPMTGDILHARQYDSIADIQDWIDDHPGVYDACDLLPRTSAYDGSLVQLTSKQAGVVLTVGQGSGIGRVVDVLFFDPTL